MHSKPQNAMTDLLARSQFSRRLSQTLISARQRHSEHVLCYLEIDRFHQICRDFGAETGELVVEEIVTLLRERIWPRDVLARLDEGELGLLLLHCPVDKAVEIVKSVLESTRELNIFGQNPAHATTLSAGIVAVDADSEGEPALLNQGAIACFTARELGGDRLHVYRSSSGRASRRQESRRSVSALAEALRLEQFRLYAQPIVPLKPATRSPLGFEILLRWSDAENRIVMPDCFIPTAERHGMMEDIDRWVIRTVLSLHHRLPAAIDHVTINVSGQSLSQGHFLDFVVDQLDYFKVAAERICFEITETAAVSHLDQAAALIRELQAHGCRFALDDFGTGLSSFSYLKHLPVNYLKIDRSFVKEVASDRIDFGVVTAIHQIARVLGIETIAEGVEDNAAMNRLRDLEIHHAQGFFLGHPQPIESLLARPVNASAVLA